MWRKKLPTAVRPSLTRIMEGVQDIATAPQNAVKTRMDVKSELEEKECGVSRSGT